MGSKEVINYNTTGVCCKVMQVEIADDTVANVDFFGGCDGNLKGICVLLKGMKIDDVIDKFKGIPCGNKPTSCPDQLAACLAEYKAKKQSPVA